MQILVKCEVSIRFYKKVKERIVLKKYLSALMVITILAFMLTGCNVTITPSSASGVPTSSNASTSSNSQLHWGVQTKTSGCMATGGLPDSACTPGAIFSNVGQQEICQSGYASSVRNVPTSEKDQAYNEYGIIHHLSGQYEVDHLISLELGGSNDIANLWPEAASPTPGFHQKDQVENYLHDQVCSGTLSLNEAQAEIATNWLTVYNNMPKQ